MAIVGNEFMESVGIFYFLDIVVVGLESKSKYGKQEAEQDAFNGHYGSQEVVGEKFVFYGFNGGAVDDVQPWKYVNEY